jgi:hypothetical protein
MGSTADELVQVTFRKGNDLIIVRVVASERPDDDTSQARPLAPRLRSGLAPRLRSGLAERRFAEALDASTSLRAGQ